MNYLENQMDVTQISKNGWGGTAVVDSNNKYMLLTAVNGQETFAWSIPSLVKQELYFEFDYKFTITDNWELCMITDSNSYAGSFAININCQTEWCHFKQKVTPKNPYIGINVRGTDKTGKSLALAVKNLRLYSKSSNNNKLCKSGNCITDEILESDIFSIYPNTLYSSDFIEN